MVRSDFAVTERDASALAEVCRRLDGNPLAIELAAARIDVLSVPQIAERLDERFHLLTGGSRTAPASQQTLLTAMDWSWELLAPDERSVLARLSVFAGGWAIEAAESMCTGDGIEAPHVLDLLSALAAKSLISVDVQNGCARHLLLETVRQYARQKLIEAANSDCHSRRHGAYYLGLAERAESELRGPDQTEWMDRLETEHDNLRAALDWARDKQDAGTGLRMVAALYWFWLRRAYWAEGRECTEAVLRLPDSARREITAAGAAAASAEGSAMGVDEAVAYGLSTSGR